MPEAPSRRFAVALSFADPQRGYVETIDTALEPYFTKDQVFLYTRHPADGAGPNLDDPRRVQLARELLRGSVRDSHHP